MPPLPEDDDDLPRLLSGRYRLEATLGHGGMGVVYRGMDLMMKRPIAVKLIRSVDGVELDDEIAGRFLREAKNTARIQHEHIIEVFDLGRSDEGGMYFVMELLEGESLSARIRREGAMSAQRTVHIGRQICEALQVAHTAGVVHRDLKPANVMLLRRAGVDDYVKVLDFGVAKSVGGGDQETQLTHTGMLVGTVDYMAPEQIMGKPVDGRTDVYALGVVLYKMLSGKAPFRDTGVPALIHAHLNTMPQPLIEVVNGIPNELSHVVLRCLAKSPDRRYESMAELGRALGMSIAPDSAAAMLSFEYKEPNSDPYAADDMTAVGKSIVNDPPSPAPPVRAARPAAGAPSASSSSSSSSASASASAAPSALGSGSGPVAPPRPKTGSGPAPLASPPKLPARFDQPLSDDDDATFNENPFDDATIRIDRPLDLKPKAPSPGGLPMTPRAPSNMRDMGSPPRIPRANATPVPGSLPKPPPRNAPAYPEDVSTAKRQIPDEITRIDRTEPKTCAMCQTTNPPHSRVCAACGVSLSNEEQDAVRARVRSAPPMPRTAGASAPPMGPPVSGTFDMSPSPHQQQAVGVGSGPYGHLSPHPHHPHAQPHVPPPPHSHPHPMHGQVPGQTPMHGVPSMQWLPHQPPPPQQQPVGVWRRFLKWTGLG